MIVAFDSSVLVAGLYREHVFHRTAVPWLDRCAGQEIEGVASWHAAAETWATLTRLPVASTPLPEQARETVLSLDGTLRFVPQTAETYRAALARCASRGLRSGAIFDALHLVTAEETGAAQLVTFNAKDFTRLTMAESPDIVVPESAPA